MRINEELTRLERLSIVGGNKWTDFFKSEDKLVESLRNIDLRFFDFKYTNTPTIYCGIKGGASRAITSLIYCSETEVFVKEYLGDVLQILEDVISERGILAFEINVNNLAWLSYERIVVGIAYKLGIPTRY